MTPELRALRSRLLVPVLALGLTHGVGVVGYWLLWRSEGGTVLDALFMTFTTITTIGFGEVRPLGPAGRVLTMVIAASGIGSLFFAFGVVMDYLSSEPLRLARRRRRMQKAVEALAEHHIIAGLGRVGRQAALEFRHAGVPFVVVDPSERVEREGAEQDFPVVRGDAASDEVLQRAGILRARGIIVTTANDATNLYVVMSARLLNPRLFIAARAADEASIPKLQRAGADRVVSPYAIGGRRLAHLVLNPNVVDFFETALQRGHRALDIDDLRVDAGTRAVGRPLEALRISAETGATVLAVLRDGSVLSPHAGLVLQTGDHLLALGTEEQLERLAVLLGQREQP